MRAASMYSVSQMIVKNCSAGLIDVVLDERNIKSLVSLTIGKTYLLAKLVYNNRYSFFSLNIRKHFEILVRI